MNTILHISVVVLLSVQVFFEPFYSYKTADCKTLLPFCVLASTRKKTYSRLSARDFTVVFLFRLY